MIRILVAITVHHHVRVLSTREGLYLYNGSASVWAHASPSEVGQLIGFELRG